MKFSVMLIAFGLLTSCSTIQIDRDPASMFDLKKILGKLREELNSPPESHKLCYEKANHYYDRLFNISASPGDFALFSHDEIEVMLKSIFESKLMMRSYLGQLDMSRNHSERCFHSTRDLLRAVRYAEDYLIEYSALSEMSAEQKKEAGQFINLTGEGPHFRVNPAYTFKDYNDLQSGDVILSRGNAYTSAAIARIGISDAQFSHVSFVYKDQAGKLWTTEAHIEVGSVVEPIATHIGQGNTRTVVFRYKDQAIAHKSSEYIFKLVKAAQEKGRNVPYDFSMNYKDSKELFCSEVVTKAMRDQGQLDIPKYKTKFNPKLLPFLQQFGIKVDERSVLTFDTFAPGDLELDPHFTVVTEWRNPLKLRSSRIRDAVLTKIFEWMEKDQYRFHPDSGMSIKASMGWLMRRLPLVKRSVEHKFPTNMKPGQLKLFMVLEKVAEVLEKELEKQDTDPQKPLSFQELYAHLEKFKHADYQKFKVKKKSSAFHQHFSPN